MIFDFMLHFFSLLLINRVYLYAKEILVRGKNTFISFILINICFEFCNTLKDSRKANVGRREGQIFFTGRQFFLGTLGTLGIHVGVAKHLECIIL